MVRIGIDVGGTKAAYGLFDEDNRLLDRRQHLVPVDTDGPGLSEILLGNILSILRENGVDHSRVEGIGIGMPSFILYDRGYVYMTSALVNVRDFAMRDWFRERLDIPVAVDKDSNASAVAEHRYGAGRGARNMVYTTVGTGLGSGLIINGELFHGSYGWAVETGHMLITPDQGLECGCRNRGCFMSYASGRYLPDHMKRLGAGMKTEIDLTGDLNGYVLKQGLDAGDPLAEATADQLARYIGILTVNLYLALNINLFVFGGGLVNLGNVLFDRVRAVFDRYNHVDMPVEFKFAELKQDYGIIGAAEFVRDLPKP